MCWPADINGGGDLRRRAGRFDAGGIEILEDPKAGSSEKKGKGGGGRGRSSGNSMLPPGALGREADNDPVRM